MASAPSQEKADGHRTNEDAQGRLENEERSSIMSCHNHVFVAPSSRKAVPSLHEQREGGSDELDPVDPPSAWSGSGCCCSMPREGKGPCTGGRRGSCHRNQPRALGCSTKLAVEMKRRRLDHPQQQMERSPLVFGILPPWKCLLCSRRWHCAGMRSSLPPMG